MEDSKRPLSDGELHQLRRWNTPTIYNGWEQITALDSAAPVINQEDVQDFMPQMGTMAGWAVTVVIEPSQAGHKQNRTAWADYRRYIASLPGPKVVVVQDLDKPRVIGSFWGEVNGSFHRAMDCLGTITDGAIRDLDEMNQAGFKGLARRLCVGHAHATPVRWGCEVQVFGTSIQPGQLVLADKHGFIAIPPGEERGLLKASIQMDVNECETVIPAANAQACAELATRLERVSESASNFQKRVQEQFGRRGEH
jgi:4-hydroxy-4-methyl-2-oxoglutarate aldolase